MGNTINEPSASFQEEIGNVVKRSENQQIGDSEGSRSVMYKTSEETQSIQRSSQNLPAEPEIKLGRDRAKTVHLVQTENYKERRIQQANNLDGTQQQEDEFFFDIHNRPDLLGIEINGVFEGRRTDIHHDRPKNSELSSAVNDQDIMIDSNDIQDNFFEMDTRDLRKGANLQSTDIYFKETRKLNNKGLFSISESIKEDYFDIPLQTSKGK